mmetsp:Transcript_27964/g.59043  ORF Transcript_27964/g.59043 Transcript_27964/m.59043 type:complete len:233 (-) Transcript_27964:89-787(-)
MLPIPIPAPVIPPPIVLAPAFQPLHLLATTFVLGFLFHIADETDGDRFDVHEVAEASTAAGVLVEISASRFPKVRDGTKLHFHLPSIVIPSIHHVERIGGLLLLGKFCVGVSDHVIAEIVAYVKGFQSSEFGELFKEIFKKRQKILPRLRLIDLHSIHAPSLPRRLQFRLARRMPINVLDQDRLTEGRTVMDARAAIGVAAGSYFEVEGTVHLVLFRSVDACQMPCHFAFFV